MTLQEFINKYDGKKVDWDGSFGAQCMDLYRFYLRDVWGRHQTPGVTGAYQVFGTVSENDYEKFAYKPGGIPEPGDVITWNESFTKYGHIGIVRDANSKRVTVFDQNSPIGSASRINTYSYNNVIGWFRPRKSMYPITIKATVVFNGGVWPSSSSKLQEIRNWYNLHSGDKLDPVFTPRTSNFSSIPFLFYPDGSAVIDEKWFDANVFDPQAHTTILVVRDEDLPDNHPGGKLVARTSGYFGKTPTKTVVACSENELSEIYPAVNAFVDYTRHELMHTCYLFSGYSVGNETFGQDQTHKYFYDLRNPEGAFSELDYQRIINTLKGDSMITIRFEDSPTKYILADELTLIGLASSTALTKTLKGRREDPKVLPATQRAAFTIADSAIN